MSFHSCRTESPLKLILIFLSDYYRLTYTFLTSGKVVRLHPSLALRTPSAPAGLTAAVEDLWKAHFASGKKLYWIIMSFFKNALLFCWYKTRFYNTQYFFNKHNNPSYTNNFLYQSYNLLYQSYNIFINWNSWSVYNTTTICHLPISSLTIYCIVKQYNFF